MKKMFLILLALCVALIALPAFAEDGVSNWTLYTMTSGTYDLDGDGTPEEVSFDVQTDEYGDGTFTVAVNGNSATYDCCNIEPTLYCMRTGFTTGNGETYYYGTLLMVSEYGPSDDPYTYMLYYVDGELQRVGAIPALADSIIPDGNNGFTTTVRANMIGTWSRPADYKLAVGYEMVEDMYVTTYCLTEVPRMVYPMGMIVTMKQDVAALAAIHDTVPTVGFTAGEKVILAATDDVSTLYITSMDGSVKGWTYISSTEDGQMVYNGNEYCYVDDVFDNITYAD